MVYVFHLACLIDVVQLFRGKIVSWHQKVEKWGENVSFCVVIEKCYQWLMMPMAKIYRDFSKINVKNAVKLSTISGLAV